jgi:fluoride ion exporter CrcB/FEX
VVVTYLNQTLKLAAVATAILGLIVLVWPNQIVAEVEVHKTTSTHFVRFIGAALIGFSVLNWLYSSFADWKIQAPAIYGNLASLTIASLLDIVALVQNRVESLGWGLLILHLAFGLAFLKCVFIIQHFKRTVK